MRLIGTNGGEPPLDELESTRRELDAQRRALAKARATAGGERELREDLESELADRQRRLDRTTFERDQASYATEAERAARAAAEQELADERSRSAGLEARVTELEQRLERAVTEREKAPAPAKGRAARPEVDVQTAGGCAVCQHPPDGDDLDKLRADGWIAHSGTLLCPGCQADGWRFPPEATFPLRRYSDRVRHDEPAPGDPAPDQPEPRRALAGAGRRRRRP